MTGTGYEKANKIVIELKRQLDDNPDECLKKIIEFLESQSDQILKKIGTKMRHQMADQSKINKIC